MAKGATVRDIAKKANVAISTVSLVLNRRPNVSIETCERVHKAMKELNYKMPPSSASSVRKRKTKRITLSLIGQPRFLLYNTIYSEIVRGVEEALNENDLSLVLSCSPDLNDLADNLAKQSFDGLIFIGADDDINYDVHKAIWRHPCVNVMGLPGAHSWFDQVCTNDESVGKIAADYLLDHGHKNFAFIGREEGVFKIRRESFRKRIEEKGGNIHEFANNDLVELTPDTHVIRREILTDLVDQILCCEPKPTGILVDSDTIVTSVYQYLLEKGIKIGRDLEVVSCHNEKNIIANLHPRPAVVDVQAYELGQRAVEQLLWRIDHMNAPRAMTIYEPILLPGQEQES